MNNIDSPSSVYRRDGQLVLRTARASDALMIASYFQRNREFLKPWEPRRQEIFYTVAGWAQRLIKMEELHKFALGFYCLLVDADSDEMLGTISFSNLSRFPLYSATVGYSMDEDAQGHGYMSRGLKMACEYMFSVQNLHRIQAGFMPHNKRSEAVLTGNGFEREGYAKDYLLIDGVWQDHVLMSLVNADWQEVVR